MIRIWSQMEVETDAHDDNHVVHRKVIELLRQCEDIKHLVSGADYFKYQLQKMRCPGPSL